MCDAVSDNVDRPFGASGKERYVGQRPLHDVTDRPIASTPPHFSHFACPVTRAGSQEVSDSLSSRLRDAAFSSCSLLRHMPDGF